MELHLRTPARELLFQLPDPSILTGKLPMVSALQDLSLYATEVISTSLLPCDSLPIIYESHSTTSLINKACFSSTTMLALIPTTSQPTPLTKPRNIKETALKAMLTKC
ncbi:hypothetical protein AMTRI_Chr03g138430 [Amborella trichopoda]